MSFISVIYSSPRYHMILQKSLYVLIWCSK